MKDLHFVESFGGTDADNDDILLDAFEDHEAYIDIIGLRRHMVIGKKGSGGSEYMFKYREPRTRFDPTSSRYRIHPGLIEVMGLKRA